MSHGMSQENDEEEILSLPPNMQQKTHMQNMACALSITGLSGVSRLDTPELQKHCFVLFVAYTSKLD